ncbi:DUF2167 domain-containing protein [Luteibacter sp. PPL201]|uniref:DUF2167 domain-containing protein n=1 Tax=Luteibacter sahnii TaxID=3021977 RepID=A0ABT6BCW5_9GAMM|nr:DUF2167 domain-containing protein [Luteibacter sp. PPL193]MDY1549365.1 DUF2167 domain-containing protein [Luteibacter sp. PPL193]
MLKFARRIAALVALSFVALVAHAQDIKELPWQRGPTEVRLGGEATLKVPEGYAFLDPAGTRRLDTLMQNPSSEGDSYTLAPDDLAWFAFFTYDDIGYVKDDDTLDANALLSSVTKDNEASNEERRKSHWSTVSIAGWKTKPQYDTTFKSLTWAFIVRDDQTHEDTVNYNARLLGRTGVMSVDVVADPAGVDSAIAQFKDVVRGFAFNPGQSYTDFRAGDRIAEYGLGALIVGGAAAVAAKKGFFAVLLSALAAGWKFLLMGLAAVGAFFKRLVGRGKR